MSREIEHLEKKVHIMEHQIQSLNDSRIQDLKEYIVRP